MNKCRVAIVGCGEIAQIRYLPAVIKMPELSLTALVDKDRGAMARVAASFQLTGVVQSTDLSEVLDHVDAVIVTAPAKWHPALCQAAIFAGKHVLVEKPLAASYEGAKEIYDAAAKMGVTVWALPFNDYPGIKKAALLARSGILGNPVSAQATHVHYAAKDTPQFFQKGLNDVLADVAFYPLSRLIDILGPITQVTGSLVNHRPELNSPEIRTNYPDTFETGVLLVDFLNGANGALTVSSAVGGLGTTLKRGTAHSNSFQQYTIYMEKGVISTDGKQRLSVFTNQKIEGELPTQIEGGVGICFDDRLALEAESEENTVTWSGFRILDSFQRMIGLPADLSKLQQEVHICEIVARVKQSQRSMSETATVNWFCRSKGSEKANGKK